MKHPAAACVIALIGVVLMVLLWSESRKTWSVQSHLSVDLSGNYLPAPALRAGDELVGSQFFVFGSHRALIVFAVLIVGSLFAPAQSGRIAFAFLALATVCGVIAWTRWRLQYVALDSEMSTKQQSTVSYIGTQASDNALYLILLLAAITALYLWATRKPAGPAPAPASR